MMTEVYILKAFRDDHIGAIHEQEVSVDDDHLNIAKELSQRFGLGSLTKYNGMGQYLFEDGEVITYFRLTPSD